MLFLDCDHFKHVNDTWGHVAGDALLRDIATRLPTRLRDTDVLGRHGGDEFVVMATVSGQADAAALAQRVHAFSEEPVRILPGRVHTITPSIGVAVAPPDDRMSTDELVGRADIAMYEAKQRGRGRFVTFDDELAQRSRTRASVGARLGEAIRTDFFDLDLQPILAGRDTTR